MLSNLHKIARKADLLIDETTYKAAKTSSLIDPDQFFISSGLNLAKKRYSSLWKIHSKELLPKLKYYQGYTLDYKESTINHLEAGNGIFFNSNNLVTAGKLLGLVPGVIFTR